MSAIAATDTTQVVAAITGTVPHIKRGTAYSAKRKGYIMTYTHNEIRAFMVEDANGTIVEQALIACKNLESAVYKRKALTDVERTACLMLIQCANELAQHLDDKPIDNTRSMLPREIREGLKRDIALKVVEKSKHYRYSVDMLGERIDDNNSSKTWRFNTDARVYLWTC